jgi:DNA-binding NarL/FixJ family response regulator
VKSAENVSTALDLLNTYVPDLIISDIVMPEQDGYYLIKLMKSQIQYCHIPFIFLSAKGMTQDRISGYDLGCHGYIIKPFDPAELLSIIKNILLNIKSSGREKNVIVKDRFNFKQINEDTVFTLQEQKILELVLQGMTNKEIADVLYFTLRNVEKYVSRLLFKTGTKNRTHLAQYFYRKKINNLEGE